LADELGSDIRENIAESNLYDNDRAFHE